MDNTRKKLIDAIASLENIYDDCLDIFIKEVARKQRESEEIKSIFISFTDLITNIKKFKQD